MKLRIKNEKKNKGFVLVITLIFLVILTLFGIWATNLGNVSLRVSTAIKRYIIALNLANGGLKVSIKALEKKTPTSPNWNPTFSAIIPSANLDSYVQETNVTSQVYSSPTSFDSKVEYEGYDNKPLPGWMLNWQGYGGFHSYHYKAYGYGKFSTTNSTVSALVLKIVH